MSEYEVGEIPPEQLKKQAKRYGLEDFVKGRVDDETLDRIAHKADELQRMNLSKKYNFIPPEERGEMEWVKKAMEEE